MAENVNDGSEVTPTFRDDDDPESQKVYSSRGRGAGLNDDEEGGLYEVIPDFMKRTNNLRESLDSKPIVLEEKKSIIESIQLALSDEFQQKLKNVVNPYGEGNSSIKILEEIQNSSVNNILKKEFYNINK